MTRDYQKIAIVALLERITLLAETMPEVLHKIDLSKLVAAAAIEIGVPGVIVEPPDA